MDQPRSQSIFLLFILLTVCYGPDRSKPLAERGGKCSGNEVVNGYEFFLHSFLFCLLLYMYIIKKTFVGLY